jgi:predicted transcriptional regulator
VYDYAAGKAEWLANGLPSEGELASEPRIGSLAIRDVPTCRLGDRVGDVHADLCVVVNANGVILGDLRGKALKAPPETLVEDVMNPAPSTYRPNVSVHQMAHELAESNARRVLVSDTDGRLIGLLRREDVQHALHEQHANGPVLALDRSSRSKKEADNERTNG